jgi:DNA repair protein REV1
MHIDMDCFFVSVGLRKHPELRGKPVAVTHSRAIGGVNPRGQNIEKEIQLRARRKDAGKLKQKIKADAERSELVLTIFFSAWITLGTLYQISRRFLVR